MSLAIDPAVASAQRSGYLQSQFPVAVILGSFLVLTLPLCIFSLADPALLERFYVKPLFLWVLGSSHFVITLTIYLQSRNLQYFNSTWTNRLLYFMVPAGIFVIFDLYTALQVAIIAPAFDGLLRAGIRLMDNHHVTRQSFGVTQLFKKRSGKPFPRWMRSAEDTFFHVLTAMLLLTFFSGGQFNPGNIVMAIGAAIALGLFLAVVSGFVWMWRHSDERGALMTPIVYFLMQSASTALGVYQTSLYIYCLAMHYVEYHVLMVPRCFDSKLDANSRIDRLFGSLRRRRTLFYALILVVAGAATYLTWITMGWLLHKNWSDWPAPYRVLIALFDGLFVFHYFIEALIWKFGNPFYRNTLGPMYFGPSAPGRPIAATTPVAR